jgi:hypothetical protein
MPCRWPAAGENCVAGVCEPVVEEENELELSTSADQPVFPGSLVAAVATTRRPAAGELMVVPRQNHRRNNVTAAKLVGRSFGE